jgi:hypothetical protein
MLTYADAAESLIERSAYHCARTLYKCLQKYFPTKKKVWMASANLEKKHGTPEVCSRMLTDADRCWWMLTYADEC